jgi:hypothetical protein
MFRFNLPGAERETAARISATAAPAPVGPVFVQLGTPSTRADIFRKDYAIPAFEIDPSIIGDLIVGPAVVNKVVSQSILPGTVVAKGTQIEITLAPPSAVPGRIIRDGHIELADRSMEQVYNDFVRDSPNVKAVLNRNPDVSRMSTSDQAIIAHAAESQGIDIGAGPGESIGNLATSLHLARTMMET